jgi:hypothetical protein
VRGQKADSGERVTHGVVLRSLLILRSLNRSSEVKQEPDVLSAREDVKVQFEVLCEVLDLLDIVVLRIAFVVGVVSEEVDEAEEGGFPEELAFFCSFVVEDQFRSSERKKGRKNALSAAPRPLVLAKLTTLSFNSSSGSCAIKKSIMFNLGTTDEWNLFSRR